MNVGDKVRIERFGDWLITLQQHYRPFAYDFKDKVLTVEIAGEEICRVVNEEGQVAFVQNVFLTQESNGDV